MKAIINDFADTFRYALLCFLFTFSKTASFIFRISEATADAVSNWFNAASNEFTEFAAFFEERAKAAKDVIENVECRPHF